MVSHEGVVQKPSASQRQPSKCNWEKADMEGPKGTASPGLDPGLQTLPGELVRMVVTLSLWLPALLTCEQDNQLFTTFSHFAKYRCKVARRASKRKKARTPPFSPNLCLRMSLSD